MSLSRHATPEIFFTESLHRVEALYKLSQQYAANGDVVQAVNSLWAADIATIQMIAWERVVIASPNPDKKFFEVASTVAKAMTAYATSSAGLFRSAQDAVESARKGIEAAFDDSFLRLLHGRYTPTTHLATLPAPTPADIAASAQERLQGMSPEDFAASRFVDAEQYAADCRAAVTSGDINGAIEAAYNADMLAFEGYLVRSANKVGDFGFLTVPLRLDLAAVYISQLPGLPYDVTDAVNVIRGCLARAIGPAEAMRLQRVLPDYA